MMAQQAHAVQPQSDHKNGHKPEPAVDSEQIGDWTTIAELSVGLLGANGNGGVVSQAARLGTSYLHTVQRQVMAARIGQLQGNLHLQRLLKPGRRSVSVAVIQRHEEDEADVQRQPAVDPVPAPPDPASPVVPKDPTKDDAFVNQTIEAFPSEVLKTQIGTSMKNRRNFLVGMQQYIGSLDDVIDHFKKIRAVQGVPALEKAHLHETAATRIEMVANKLGPELMPKTDVALGLRDRYHPHMRQPRGLMAHPCGYAIDFRAVTNPHITDPRLVKLIAMRTSGAGAMNLGSYWSIIKRMGEQTAKGGIDPNSSLGKEAAEFQTKLESEFKRVSEGSKKFQTELKDTRVELLAVYKKIKDINSELQKIAVLKNNPKKLKKSGKTLAQLAQEAQVLNEQKKQYKDQAKPDLARFFKPWLDQINQEIQAIQAEVKKVLPAGDPAKLLSKAELSKQEQAVKQQLREILRKKKQAEATVKKLNREIEKEKELIAASQKRITQWDATIAKTQASPKGPDLTTRKSAEQQKIVAHEASIAQKGKEIEQEQAVVTEQATAETAAQQTLQNIDQQKKLLPQASEFKRLESLKQSLTSDTDFVFEGKEAHSNPAVAQLLEKGYFNPDPARQPGEKFNSEKHGFDLAFFKAMTEHGFELGASWTPGNVDPMHLQLVEGVDKIRDVKHPPKPVGQGTQPAKFVPPQAPQQKQQVQPKLSSTSLRHDFRQPGNMLLQRQPQSTATVALESSTGPRLLADSTPSGWSQRLTTREYVQDESHHSVQHIRDLVALPYVQRQPGWSNASKQSRQSSQLDKDLKPLPPDKPSATPITLPTSWNADKTLIEDIWRIPIDGLPHGNRSVSEDLGAMGSTPESPVGKAIVLQHINFNKEHKARVLLHLHGYGSGYRQLDNKEELKNQLNELKQNRDDTKRELDTAIKAPVKDKDKINDLKAKLKEKDKEITKTDDRIRKWHLDRAGILQPGQARDVELYRMEQQLHALNQPQTIAVLPQGTSKDEFNYLRNNSSQYVDEVFTKLGVARTDYSFAVSGHSAGGRAAMAIANKLDTAQPSRQIDGIILFDSHGSDSSTAAEGWLNRHIAADMAALKKMNTTAEVDSYFSQRTSFRGYFTPGYAPKYETIKKKTAALRKSKVLQGQLNKLNNDKKKLEKTKASLAKSPKATQAEKDKVTEKMKEKDDQLKTKEALQEHIREKLVHQYQVIGPIKVDADKDARHEKVMGAQNDQSKSGILDEALSALEKTP